jgi:hypothetical protein
VAAFAQDQRLGRKRRTAAVYGASADIRNLIFKLKIEFFPDCLENFQRFLHDFGPDAISGQYGYSMHQYQFLAVSFGNADSSGFRRSPE